MTSIGRQVLNRWALMALVLAAALAAVLAMQPLAAQDSTFEYAENGTDPVATFTADDPEGSTSITWWIAGATGAPTLPTTGFTAADNQDSDLFMIDNEDGMLKFIASPDYEAPGGGSGNDSNTYNVVVAAADGVVGATGTESGFHKVTVEVTNIDEPGKVTWLVAPDGSTDQSVTQFDVGGARLTASATDGDIAGTDKAVTNAIWRWYRSPDDTSAGTLIEGANTNIYATTLDDAGMYIRVVAHYVVAGNVDQETASLTSGYPVMAERVGTHDLEFDPTAVSRSVAEGEKGANVGAPVTATGNHGAVYYTLAGADAARFEIDQKTGQITTALELDYEGVNPAAAGPPVVVGSCAGADGTTPDRECVVEVTARDASGEATATAATVTIMITNVDEPPTFPSAALTAVSRDENSADLVDPTDTAAVATVTYMATDPERRNIVYTLMGADAAKFKLSASQVLSFRAEPDFESPTDADRDNVYEVTVRANDGTMTADKMVKVTVTGEDEAPVIMGRDSVDYRENGEGAVATFTARDPEGATSITWAIAGTTGAPTLPSDIPATDNEDSALFTIDEDGMLEFSASPDYENATDQGANNTYQVVVAASDAATGGQTGFHEVTVKVTNVPEAGKVTWTVAPDGSTVQSVTQFDVGAALTATAEDGDIAGATKTFTASTDAGVTNVIWQWHRGSTVIPNQITNTYTVALADVGQRIRATVTYQVGTGTTQERASLTSAFPVLADRVGANALEFDPTAVSRSVAEGDKGANVGAPVTATGNHGAVNYTLGSAGGDEARFEIDQKTGQITTALELDYEGVNPAAAGPPVVVGSCAGADGTTPDRECVVEVIARDASGDTAPTNATVTIALTDVDEGPTFSTGAETVTVDEGVEIVRADSNNDGAFDGSDDANLYVATDEDGLNVNLSLMGPDAADFSLDNTGVLSFRTAPDYEMPADANRDNLYQVTVRASDGTMHADRMVRVTVENVNEAPAIISGGVSIAGPASVSYPENDTAAVGTYTARGENAASAEWMLEGDDAGDFSLSASSGESTMLMFKYPPNFEIPADDDDNNVYMVTVKATANGDMDTHEVTVTVTDDDTEPTTLRGRYDTDNNNQIDLEEALNGIDDYFTAPIGSVITLDEVLDLIGLYFDDLRN